MYRCNTCGETVVNLAAARKHAKQGYKTQRDSFNSGNLHTLELDESGPYEVLTFRKGGWSFVQVCDDKNAAISRVAELRAEGGTYRIKIAA